MQVTIIGPDVRKQIAELIQKAEQNVVSLETMKKLAGKGYTYADNADFTILIPMKTTVTYTHEDNLTATCKHLSVSVNKIGKLPTPEMVLIIMNEFGFKNKSMNDVVWWIEDCGGNCQAINVIEPLSGNMDEIRSAKEKDEGGVIHE